jgi:hypothetical protein
LPATLEHDIRVIPERHRGYNIPDIIKFYNNLITLTGCAMKGKIDLVMRSIPDVEGTINYIEVAWGTKGCCCIRYQLGGQVQGCRCLCDTQG